MWLLVDVPVRGFFVFPPLSTDFSTFHRCQFRWMDLHPYVLDSIVPLFRFPPLGARFREWYSSSRCVQWPRFDSHQLSCCFSLLDNFVALAPLRQAINLPTDGRWFVLLAHIRVARLNLDSSGRRGGVGISICEDADCTRRIYHRLVVSAKPSLSPFRFPVFCLLMLC